MISVDDAQARLLALIQDLGNPQSETLAIADSIGRVLHQDVIARRDQPPFASAAMDGYAVHWADIQILPVPLKLIGESHAGTRFPGTVKRGEAVRILTGAPVPNGADTIVVQEDTSRADATVIINDRPEKTGGHIRRAGLDCMTGNLLAKKGTVISAARAGLIAASAISHVEVAQKIRLDLVMCGDELRLPGQSLGADQIVSTNGLVLASLLKEAGADVVGADNIIPDDLDALTAVFRNSEAQIIVTAGGASVGDRDFVQAALVAAGGKIEFWKIAMRPGKPLMIATLGTKLIIGLPGNPVSAFVGAILFGIPAVRAMQGHQQALPDTHAGHWAEARPAGGPRADYVRVKISTTSQGLALRALPVQDSSMLSVLADADALAVVPMNALPAQPGDPAAFLLLPKGT